ncbi:NAD(P)/FAD-dependent oxidoreductase [Corynebacterium sp. TAE3-ERU12]|uniref:flavin-containing monooxygenase n=1 Tax=Corynebacterium sp. TAE3-ERU12 TaxID=2849491 RepID=UPI001C47254E|nr:NAD(P)/FAD-dependent oxidoreductase [Corynebacterium sp. TAE3-ERU12]MBV7294792.1 NAD(P)/FAD-dependent oxidoreductase [Corynebacterium sp. TAE3-ERU12]
MESTVLIIGAGPSGLATAAHLTRAGIAYDHVERHNGVGGLWDIDNPYTPMYESAHFISSTKHSGYPGRSFPEGTADYPSRSVIHRYLQDFAHDTGVGTHIQFGTGVKTVAPTDGGFTVTFDNGTTSTYRDVVCATGTLAEPKMPHYPGEFTGEYRHSSTYRSIDELRGKRVLIIGAGNSGCDIACDAAQAADHADISMRRGYWFIPKHILGRPSDDFTTSSPNLPTLPMQWITQIYLRLHFGNLRRLGIPKPDHRVFETHPLLNDQLIHHLRHGDIRVRPDVARFDGDAVVFTDGTREHYDLVLACTGYRHVVPVARELFGGEEAMGKLYLRCAHRTYPGLWAPGMIETNSGAFGIIDRQARLIAAVVAGRDSGMGEVFAHHAATEYPDLSGGIAFDRSSRHAGYADSHSLIEALDAELDLMGG